ncbi:MAG: alpha-2-macroglobulin [Tannerellaceae bacterium]|jgi:5-hydroxyisourate hydrolase-like protein (transthyretin family)|nr:alpha-2-macroglobulin [Tannerellaceae bacterium]
MKKIVIPVISLLIAYVIPVDSLGQTYDALWKQVEQAKKKSLPQTVIQLTDKVFQKAEAEKNSTQMLKAFTERASYRELITPDSFYVDLEKMEEWVKTSGVPTDCAILHLLLADQYATFASMNRRQLGEHAEIVDNPPVDIRQWSGNMFRQKTLDHIRKSFEDQLLLTNATTVDYIPFLTKGETSDYYDHDLFHLLSRHSVEVLNKILFLDGDSVVTRELDTIFDRISRVYREKGNNDALLLATLDSLQWRNKNRNDTTYLQTLDSLIALNVSRDLNVEVYLAKIRDLKDKNELTAALQTCEEALAKYPRYKRINAVKAMKQEILKPALSVSTGKTVYPSGEIKLHVTHRNLDGFTVHYHRTDHPARKTVEHIRLIRPENYMPKDTTFTLKAPDDEGLYTIRIVPDAKTGEIPDHVVASTRLKTLTRKLPSGRFEIVVLDAMSGQPVAGATVRLYTNKKGTMTETAVYTVNEDGKIELPWNNTDQQISAEKGKDRFMFPQYVMNHGDYRFSTEREVIQNVTLLTDRSLYRPGQTVYVKGIVYNQVSDSARVVQGKALALALVDGNNRKIGEKEVQSNEYGSFTTEFILPAAGLNGVYTLSTGQWSATIRVEEYKRPTFDLTFEQPEEAYRLGDTIEVKGTVKTFSGITVPEAPVQYTVTRTLNNRWGWMPDDKTLVASGSVTANGDGEFAIPLRLVPGEEKRPDSRCYTYIVEAHVTNPAGETQTSQTRLAAGNRPFVLYADIPKQINRDDSIRVTFEASNLSGRPVKVEGSYRLYPFTDYENRIATEQPVLAGRFVSNTEMDMPGWQTLPSGAYRVALSATDAQGNEALFDTETILFSINDSRPATDAPIWYYPIEETFDHAHPGAFIFGTSEKDVYAMMDIFSGNEHIESRIIQLSDTVMRFEYPYKASYGDGLSIVFCFVKNDEIYQKEIRMQRRLPDRKLRMTWDVFRDKLRPGQQEEWKLTVKTAGGAPAEAEMVALMYDASLDKIWKKEQTLDIYPRLKIPSTHWTYAYSGTAYYNFWFLQTNYPFPGLQYDRFPPEYRNEMIITGYGRMGQTKTRSAYSTLAAAPFPEKDAVMQPVMEDSATPDGLRTNFAETAFFYPQLRTNPAGEIILSFTIPESLTRWNFLGYSHTKEMMTGTLSGEATTAKEFMLVPALPRFVRTGDRTSVAASVVNMTGKELSGTVTWTLFDPVTEKVIETQKKAFRTEAGETVPVSFMFTATAAYDIVGCRMVAESESFSDGEQHLLPVLSNKEYVTETVAMPVRGHQRREFALETLFNNDSKTATNRRLTVEFSANPAWYAIQALPSISLPADDNAVSWATAWYANALATYIVQAQPAIKTLFDTWKQQQGGTKETLISNLQKNQELKNILLEESPWLVEAKTETEQMEHIATLFDLSNRENNRLAALTKLKELQLNNGAWTWYKGMSGSLHITHFLVEAFARLSNLTGKPLEGDASDLCRAAFRFLHAEALEEYRDIQQEARQYKIKPSGISGTALQYLYLVAISGEKVPASNAEAYTYFLNKVHESITDLSLTGKAHAAIILSKAGRSTEADAFIASLKEHAVQTDEQGLHFAFNESPYTWTGLKIPAHVSVMEAFETVAGDKAAVDEMKLWLLKQKQTQQWHSPVATANAVYALLQWGGDNLLKNQGDLRVTIGNKTIKTGSPSGTPVPGIRYIKETLTDTHVKKAVVEKQDDGIAWGAIYAQYREDMDKIGQQGGELNVEKKLYVEHIENGKKRWTPVTADTPLKIGDHVISRITIRADRSMDFVQLKDQRGACFEPAGLLSGYIRGQGCSYYVTVKDASTHFFFDSLPKGVHVVEYGYRVSRAGVYESGLATIQSAYAPEYASHSGSMKIIIITQ